MAVQKQDIKQLFLQEFVKRMIIKALPRVPSINKRDGLFQKLDKTAAAAPALKIKTKYEETPPHLTKEFLGLEEVKKEVVQPLPQQVKLVEKYAPSVKVAAVEEKPLISVFDRFIPILADPAVQSINCPGSDRFIIITRMGVIQTSNMRLSKEEITSFMKEISQKTKIPLTAGLFKVIYQDFIITAVISEFVGTRFIIEKKPLVMQPLPIMLPPARFPPQARLQQPARVTFR